MTLRVQGGTGRLEDALSGEQLYFDRAYAARENHRAELGNARHAAAGGAKAATAVRKAADKARDACGDPAAAVAHGRIDLADGSVYYIGDRAILDAEKDLLVVNFRMPVAAPFYSATVKDAHGLIQRRRFVTTRNTIDHFENTLFDDLRRRVSELTEHEQWGIDDSILSDLDARRSGQMQDIVRTIQASQYELMRAPLDQCLIIQGGPGTGKTAVALHRVSWLLFNHDTTLAPHDVLVVGPNAAFSRYIRDLLPELGDRDVVHRDMRDVGVISSTGREEGRRVLELKGRQSMSSLVARALRARVRVPDEAGVLITTSVGTTRLFPEDVKPAVDRLAHLPYAHGRNGMRAWMNRTAVDAVTRPGTTATPTIDASELDRALDRIWPNLTPQLLIQDLYASTDGLIEAASAEFTAADVGLLQRARAAKLSEEEWSDADVPVLDEAAYLISGDVHTYKHLVVDEAQDLSPMQLRMLARRCHQAHPRSWAM